MENKEQENQPQENAPKEKPKMRQVIIETDGSNINLSKNETVGNLELIALLSTILNKLQQPQR